MCRAGTQEDAWGHRVDVAHARDAEHEAELTSDGWFRQPGDWLTEPEPKRRARTT